MSKPSIDIDLVVREVLAELGAAPAGDTKKREGGREKREEGREKREKQGLGTLVPSAADGELVLTSRVVSTGELSGRLDSVRRVVVSRRAVVTPAVRDELFRRGIALEYVDPSDGRKEAIRLAMITSGTDFDPAPLAAALDREGFSVERSDSDCLIAAVDELAKETSRSDTLGVLLTPHTAAGLCLANRLPGVRAIGGSCAPEVAAAAAAVGANLLVADPRAGSFFQLKQIVAEFARGGMRSCPEVFRGRLT